MRPPARLGAWLDVDYDLMHRNGFRCIEAFSQFAAAFGLDRTGCDAHARQVVLRLDGVDTADVECREQTKPEASPTAAIIDSQSVKEREKGGMHRPPWLRRRQEDQRQETPSLCRHPGLLLRAIGYAASIRGRVLVLAPCSA